MSNEPNEQPIDDAQVLRDGAEAIARWVLELSVKLDTIQSALDELHAAKPFLQQIRAQAHAIQFKTESRMLDRRYKSHPQYGVWIKRPPEPPAAPPAEDAPTAAEAAPDIPDDQIIIHE